MPETAGVLRRARAAEPVWVKLVRLSAGATVVLALMVGAVVVNESGDSSNAAVAAAAAR